MPPRQPSCRAVPVSEFPVTIFVTLLIPYWSAALPCVIFLNMAILHSSLSLLLDSVPPGSIWRLSGRPFPPFLAHCIDWPPTGIVKVCAILCNLLKGCQPLPALVISPLNLVAHSDARNVKFYLSPHSKLVCETEVRCGAAARMCSFVRSFALSLVVLPITFLSYRSDGASRKMLVAPTTATATADSSPPPTPLSIRAPCFSPLSPRLSRRLLPSH